MTMRLAMRGILLTSCMLVAAVASSRADEAGDRAKGRFLKEYPEASRRLQEFYTNARMQVKEVEQGDEQGTEVATEWEVGGNGESVRCVGGARSGPGVAGDPLLSVIVADPQFSFRLKKDPGASQYSVLTMGMAPPKQYKGLTEMIRLRAAAASAPYCLYELPIRDFAAEKTFSIKGGSEREEAGRKVIRVDWANKQSKDVATEGWFDFAPDESWALLGYEYTLTAKDEETKEVSKTGRHARLEYEGAQGGFPILRKMETWNSGSAGKSSVTRHELAGFAPGAVPKDEFTLEEFGISVGSAPAPIPVMYYLLAFAAICGIGAVGLRRLQSRSLGSASAS
jgi:hypothetical protein